MKNVTFRIFATGAYNSSTQDFSKIQFFGQKNKCWSKIQTLVKNPNFGQKTNFGQKSKFWPKIKKSTFLARIQILAENLKNHIFPNPRQKYFKLSTFLSAEFYLYVFYSVGFFC